MVKMFANAIIVLSLTVTLFVGILITDLHAEFLTNEINDFRRSEFAEVSELRHVALSNVNVLSKQTSRSKLKCATLCDLEEKCKMFRFEAPSASCYLYREVTTGGCYGFRSRNVSSYYTHLGRVTSWLMLYFSQNHKLVFVWREGSNQWEKISLPNQMKLARIDPTNWRLYWANSAKIRGIHSSDVRGSNRKTLVPGVKSKSLDFDPVHRRLFYDGGDEDFLGMVDLEKRKATIFERGDGKPGRSKHIGSVRVLPELRFVFWTDDSKLWRRHYDESKAHQIPAYQQQHTCFTTDHLYNRLMWINSDTKYLLFTNAWGEDQIRICLSGPTFEPSLAKVFPVDGNIYLFSYESFTIRTYNCGGELIKNFTAEGFYESTDNRDLVWIPEDNYYM